MPQFEHDGAYNIFVPTGAHTPPHVHVVRDDNEVIFTLVPVAVRDDDNYGFPEHELTKIREIIVENRVDLLRLFLENRA